MDQVENQTAPSPQNLPERPSFWYLLKNPPTYHKPLVTLVAVTFFLSALGTIVYFATIGKGQISFSPPPTAIQQPTPPTSTLPTSTPTPDATANWKTFIDDTNGFTLRYPIDWTILTAGSTKLAGQTLQEYVAKIEQTLARPGLPEPQIIPPENAIKGEPITQKEIIIREVNNKFLGDANVLVAYILKDTITVITIQALPSDRASSNQSFSVRERETFDQILSTFRFTDQEQVDNSRSCRQNSDCTLFVCGGCYNKEWAKTAPPDLPCMIYAGYTCECSNNQCIEVK